MNWDVLDFAVIIALLAGVGVIYALAARISFSTAYRAAAGVALAAGFILVWINGAVGIIGNENNDANMMFLGILAVAIVGALLARFQPKGMSRALLATALAQVLVAVVALVLELGATGAIWPRDLLVLTAFFTAMWFTAAVLFRKAARQ